MKIAEPEYYVKLDMHSCPRTVIINGVIIEDNPDGYSSSTEFPVNHWIRDGENTLELFMLSDEDMDEDVNETSRCNASVWVKGLVNGEEQNHKVVDLNYTPNLRLPQKDRYKSSLPAGTYQLTGVNPTLSDKHRDLTIGEIKTGEDYFNAGGTKFYRNFTANVPFPEWSFFTAEKIFSYPLNEDKFLALEKVVWPKLVKIWDMFENKEIDKILPLFETRSQELDLAFYRKPGDSLKSFEMDLKNVYKKGLPFDRRADDEMQLVISYNEKLVTMVNAATQQGSVMFYEKESDSVTFFDIVWMKKDGKWSIIR